MKIFFRNILIVLSVIIIRLSQQSAEANDSYEIKFVWSLIRHGARSPTKLNNNKDLLDFEWDINAGELTNLGLRQLFILGLQQNERYSKLLESNQLYMISTNFNRTIMSLLSYYHGLVRDGDELSDIQKERAFPPGVTLNDNIGSKVYKNNKALGENNSVRAYHILSDGYPFHVLNAHKYCKGIPELKDDKKEGHIKNILDLLDKHKDLESIFNLNIDRNNVISAKEHLYSLADSYVSAYYNSKNIKEKYFKGNKEEARRLLNNFEIFLTREFTWGIYGEDDKVYNARIVKSRLLRIILNYLNYRTSSSSKDGNNNEIYTASNPSMVIYSMHDRDISEIMLILNHKFNINIEDKIPYASFINFELIYDKLEQTEEAKWLVRIIYNDKEIGKFNYSYFSRTLSTALITEEEIMKFCNYENEITSNNDTFLIVIIIILSIIFILLFCIIFYYYVKGQEANKTLTSGDKELILSHDDTSSTSINNN